MKVLSFFKRNKFASKSAKIQGPNKFATFDESRAPNLKQYLRGLRNYLLLSH